MAGIGSGAPVGVKPSAPGGRAPRLCPAAAAHRERGAEQPARVYLRLPRQQRELKAAETPADKQAKRVCSLQMKREII